MADAQGERAKRETSMPRKNAITILKQDHETVRGLLEQLEKTTERAAQKRETLLARIAAEVRAHAKVEEEIFYPAFRDAVTKREDRKLYFEAVEEHHVVDLVLPEIEQTDVTAEEFAGKAKVLKDLIEHHAEEEEKEMFPSAKKVLDADELEQLGEQIEQRKQELLAEMGEGQGRKRGGQSQGTPKRGKRGEMAERELVVED
jgi:hemerythrin-like domain-containing protein